MDLVEENYVFFYSGDHSFRCGALALSNGVEEKTRGA